MPELNTLKEAAKRVGERVSETRTQAEELGWAAAARMDEARLGAADALHATASSVRTGSRKTAEAIDDCASGTAAGLESTSVYVRDHDLKGMLADCWRVVRRNPGPSLLLAVAAGYFVGSTVRRK